mmetsp:Transcript_32143/g.85594  ORF Transcript_32143/g.85594 Transcript_32143/m.85594 type:complete len:228 (+) Transcript_32143:1-684(+)
MDSNTQQHTTILVEMCGPRRVTRPGPASATPPAQSTRIPDRQNRRPSRRALPNRALRRRGARHRAAGNSGPPNKSTQGNTTAPRSHQASCPRRRQWQVLVAPRPTSARRNQTPGSSQCTPIWWRPAFCTDFQCARTSQVPPSIGPSAASYVRATRPTTLSFPGRAAPASRTLCRAPWSAPAPSPAASARARAADCRPVGRGRTGAGTELTRESALPSLRTSCPPRRR